MTRAHFQLIADVVRDTPYTNREDLAKTSAARLCRTNTAFNRDRFLEACDVS
jgi:hypothetical protein